MFKFCSESRQDKLNVSKILWFVSVFCSKGCGVTVYQFGQLSKVRIIILLPLTSHWDFEVKSDLISTKKCDLPDNFSSDSSKFVWFVPGIGSWSLSNPKFDNFRKSKVSKIVVQGCDLWKKLCWKVRENSRFCILGKSERLPSFFEKKWKTTIGFSYGGKKRFQKKGRTDPRTVNILKKNLFLASWGKVYLKASRKNRWQDSNPILCTPDRSITCRGSYWFYYYLFTIVLAS